MADIRIGILALLAGVATLVSAINIVLCDTVEAFLTFFAGLGFFLVLMRTWKATKGRMIEHEEREYRIRR